MRFRFPFSSVLMALGLGLAALTAAAQPAWTFTRSNFPGINSGDSIAYGNGRFVATFDRIGPGAVGWSTDGTAWQAVSLTMDYGKVTFVAGYFHLATEGAIYRSTDGVTWQKTFTAPTGLVLRGIATDGRTLLAWQANFPTRTMYYSADGVTWRETASFPRTSLASIGVVSAFGRYFVQIYTGASPNPTSTYSTHDGTEWTAETALDTAFQLAAGNGRLVATVSNSNGSFVAVTRDGVNFTTLTYPIPHPVFLDSPLTFAGGRFFAGVSYYSIDGETWLPLATPGLPAARAFQQFTYGAGRFVAIGTQQPQSDLIAILPATGPAIITQQPGDVIARIGSPSSFAVAYDSAQLPTTVQWYFNNSPIPGATATTYTIPAIQGSHFGKYQAILTNSAGTATTLPAILWSGTTPVITDFPASRSAPEGTSVTLVAGAFATTTLTYQWSKNGSPIPGATRTQYALPSTLLADTGSYSVTVSNAYGSVTSPPATITITPLPISILQPPQSQSVLAGQPVTFAVSVSGSAPITYQWYRNNVPIPGATAATLGFDHAVPANTGDYSVTIANGAGSMTTPAASLSVFAVSRISNVSVLTGLSAPGDSFQLGFVVTGITGPEGKPLVVRAVGPSLATFGVANALADPRLRLMSGTSLQGDNDDWGGGPALAGAFNAVGAFPLVSPTSKDAGAALSVSSRDNTVMVSGGDAGTGSVLAEVYDATPGELFGSHSPRLVNVSVLKPLGTGLTVGFTITGSISVNVLVRAIGPSLATFGVVDAHPDPRLALFNARSQKLTENDNWFPITPPNAFARAGAFTLNPASKDAALTVTLNPGSYTVQVTGAAGTSGTVLVEVYELPD